MHERQTDGNLEFKIRDDCEQPSAPLPPLPIEGADAGTMADFQTGSPGVDLTLPNAGVYTSVQTLEKCSRSATLCHNSGRSARPRWGDLAPHVVSESADQT